MYNHLSYKTSLIASDDISISYIQDKDTMSEYHMRSKLHSLFHLIFAGLITYVGHKVEMNIISMLCNLFSVKDSGTFWMSVTIIPFLVWFPLPSFLSLFGERQDTTAQHNRSQIYTQLEEKYNKDKFYKTFNVGNKSTNNGNMFCFVF